MTPKRQEEPVYRIPPRCDRCRKVGHFALAIKSDRTLGKMAFAEAGGAFVEPELPEPCPAVASRDLTLKGTI